MKMSFKISQRRNNFGLALLIMFFFTLLLATSSFGQDVIKDCGPDPCPGTSPAIWPERSAPLGETIRILGWNLDSSTGYQMVVIQPDGIDFSIGSVTTNQEGDLLINPLPYVYVVPESSGLFEVRIYASSWSGDLDQGPIASTTFYNR
jgi:hypothetical protein